jgi:hypothetical protein
LIGQSQFSSANAYGSFQTVGEIFDSQFPDRRILFYIYSRGGVASLLRRRDKIPEAFGAFGRSITDAIAGIFHAGI